MSAVLWSLRSVFVIAATASFTFSIAVVVSPTTALNFAVSMPVRLLACAVKTVCMDARSLESVRSRIVPPDCLDCRVLLRAATAAAKASSGSAPAPSAAAENAPRAVVTWTASFSTASASAAFAPAANGLNVSGSIFAGRPSDALSWSASRPLSSISVVSGVITLAPAGALNVMPAKVVPEAVSIVASVVTATKGPSGESAGKLKFPDASVVVLGSSGSCTPLAFVSINTKALDNGPLVRVPLSGEGEEGTSSSFDGSSTVAAPPDKRLRRAPSPDIKPAPPIKVPLMPSAASGAASVD